MTEEYESMTVYERENYLAHSTAEVIRKMYYENDAKGLEVLIRNLEALSEYAKNCQSCIEILQQSCNVYTKINLLLDYLGHEGIDEEFLSGLEELTARAQSRFEQSGSEEESSDNEEDALNNMRALMDLELLRYETAEGISKSA